MNDHTLWGGSPRSSSDSLFDTNGGAREGVDDRNSPSGRTTARRRERTRTGTSRSSCRCAIARSPATNRSASNASTPVNSNTVPLSPRLVPMKTTFFINPRRKLLSLRRRPYV